MASRTQLRLGQITGSFGDAEGKIVDNLAAAATLGAIPVGSGSLVTALSQLASSIQRINGGAAFSSQAAGVFNHDLQIAGTTPTLTIGDNGDEDTALLFNQSGQDYYIGVDATDDDLKIGLGAAVGTGTAITLNGDANAIFAGDVTASGRVIVDDTTDATSTTDGSLQTDGGLSVALDVIAGNDVYLLSDSSVLGLGAGKDVTITHDGSTGAALASAGKFDISAGAASVIKTTAGDLTIDSDAARVILTGSSGADSVLIQSELTVSGDAVFAGNLTVNGTTTTVDTTNLLVKDKLITINDGGAASSAGGSGIEFEEDGSVTGFIKTASDRAGFEFQAPANSNTLTIDAAASKTITVTGDLAIESDSAINQDLTTDADAVFNKVTANGGLVADNITIDGTEIDLSSGDLTLDVAGNIILDADGGSIFIDDGGTRRGGIAYGNSSLMLSSSAGNNVALMSQGGSVMLANSDGTVAATFDLGTSNEVKIKDPQDRIRLTLDAGGDKSLISGSLELDNGAAAAGIVFQEANANGTNTITLDVPAAVGSSYILTLPASNGTSGQVLKLADGNGNLEFGSALGDLSKGIKIITSAVSAGTAVNFNSVDAGDTISGLAESDAQGKSLDVFVNGQLLVSGSETARAAGTRDYAIASATELKFAFDLESDDIVQAVKR